jgi:hypothetical protein
MKDLCLIVVVSSLFAGSFVMALYDTRTDHELVVSKQGAPTPPLMLCVSLWKSALVRLLSPLSQDNG